MRAHRLRGCVILLFAMGLASVLFSSCVTGQERPDGVVRALMAMTADPLMEGRDTRFSDVDVDLNGDGSSEVVVYLVSRDFCGTGGCPLLVFADRDSGRLLSKTTLSRPSIRLLESRTLGWRDLAVDYCDFEGCRSALLPFDGRGYATNPTMPPASFVDDAAGRILIPRDTPMKLLHR